MSLKRYFPIAAMALLALVLLTPRPGLAAECAAAEQGWAPGKYYARGELAHLDGQWYRAREHHLGKRPSGTTFAWEPIARPDCVSKGAVQERPAQDRPAALNPAAPIPPVPETEPSPEGKLDCSAIPVFSFGQSYLVGQRVRHQGQVYEAIRPTVSTMPGQAGPHHWRVLDKHCPQ